MGSRGRVGNCMAFVMHMAFTFPTSPPPLPLSPAVGAGRSPPALCEATFLFKQLVSYLAVTDIGGLLLG